MALLIGVTAAFAGACAGQGKESGPAAATLPEGASLAAQYPGDAGIGRDSRVIFAEDFETGTLSDLKRRWSDVRNKDGKALFLEGEQRPDASAGKRSLRVTVTRGENDSGHLFTVFPKNYDRLFLRFYVRFAPDYGISHHFVSLGGAKDPPPYPIGRAGLRPENSFSTGIEPFFAPDEKNYAVSSPPGFWHFYTYWPEMRSYENEDGTGTRFYGNSFRPEKPVPVVKDRWTCVEIMVRMNSAPEKSDGEQALWIDGKLVGRFGPGTMRGKWLRDRFRRDAAGGEPFEGFRWRKDGTLGINKLWLSHYVSEGAFQKTDALMKKHPDMRLNTRQATVWFDDVVVATEYIGPLAEARTPTPAGWTPASGP